jgi:hypothetical protein
MPNIKEYGSDERKVHLTPVSMAAEGEVDVATLTVSGSEGAVWGGSKEAPLGERADVVWIMGKQDRRSRTLSVKLGDLGDASQIVIRSNNEY